MVGMKMGETTKWSNIAFGRIPSKIPTSSMPNVNLPAYPSMTNDHLSPNSLNHQRYRTELSMNIADYSSISRRAVSSIMLNKTSVFFSLCPSPENLR